MPKNKKQSLGGADSLKGAFNTDAFAYTMRCSFSAFKNHGPDQLL